MNFSLCDVLKINKFYHLLKPESLFVSRIVVVKKVVNLRSDVSIWYLKYFFIIDIKCYLRLPPFLTDFLKKEKYIRVMTLKFKKD